MPLVIKGTLIGSGKPLVCVPVVDHSETEILVHIKELVEKEVPAIEWRVDCFGEAGDEEKLRKVLEEIRSLTPRTVMIATLRSRAEGGEADFSEVETASILYRIAEAHCVDLIDVEFYQFRNIDKIFADLHEKGAMVISSCHNFSRTPSEGELKKIFYEMSCKEADIIKVTMMPRKVSDVFSLLKVASEFHEENSDIPLIAMSMGDMGRISRILGEQIGSCISFGLDKEESAPGQMPFAVLSDVLDKIHQNYVYQG